MNESIIHCKGTFCEMRNECTRYWAHLHDSQDLANNHLYIDKAECMENNYDYYYKTKDER